MLGKFSALSVSDSCIITSIYEGICNKYLMYKDGLSIKIDEISSTPIDKHNGVEVMVYVKSLDHIYEILANMQLFNNTYLNLNNVGSNVQDNFRWRGNEIIQLFNNKLKQPFNSFYICKYLRNACVAVGDVIYPVDTTYIKVFDDFELPYDYKFVPKVKIGTVAITPNREQLLYNKETIKSLQDAYDAMKTELIDTFKKKITNKYTSKTLLTFYKICEENKVKLSYSDNFNIAINPFLLYDKYEYEGYSFNKNDIINKYDNSILSSLFRTVYPFSVHYSKKPYRKGVNKKVDDVSLEEIVHDIYSNKEAVFLYNFDILKQVYKEFLCDEYGSWNLIKVYTDKELLKRLQEHEKNYHYQKIVYKVYTKLLLDFVKTLKFFNPDTEISKEYIEEFKKSQREGRTTVSVTYPFNRYIYDGWKRCEASYKIPDDYLVIYGDSNCKTVLQFFRDADSLIQLATGCKYKHIMIAQYAKGCEEYLSNLKNSVSLQEILSGELNIAPTLKALHIAKEKGLLVPTSAISSSFVNPNILGTDVVQQAYKYSSYFSPVMDDLFKPFYKDITENKELLKTFEEANKYYELCKCITKLYSMNTYDRFLSLIKFLIGKDKTFSNFEELLKLTNFELTKINKND